MRARTIAAFILGLSIGMLGLAVMMSKAGSIQAAFPLWKKQRMAPSAFDLNEIVAEAKSLPPPALPPLPPHVVPPVETNAGTPPTIYGPPPVEMRPPVVALPESMNQRTPPKEMAKAGPPEAHVPATASPATTGSADRIAPLPNLHLAMPLAGVNPKALADTFKDARDGRKHEALDIAAPRGTPVRAVAEGNVAKLFTSKQGGLTVYQFDNGQNYSFYYAHLERYAPGLKEGTLLRKGDVLGYVGTTGNAPPNAPHLHLAVFELTPEKKWWQGTPIDPLPLLQ